ncbi:MAG: response regulator [Candidatus Hydrogenedentes bacterium]|nr:response regulator [Candidatus Hydrogenedentota bacterium]
MSEKKYPLSEGKTSCTVQDVTLMEQHYKTLVENVPGAVCWYLNDEPYSTVFISKAIEDFSGFNGESMIREAASLASMIHPEELQYVRETIDQAITQQKPYLLNYRMECKDGSYTWVEQRGQGVWNDTGELRFLQGIIFDISTRKRSETERSKIDKQLAHTHKLESLSTLAGGIAHDFNNLLVAILGHADLVAQDTESGTATYQSVNAIIQASQRAATLTQQMLAYSGKGNFMVESVDFSTLANSFVPFFETMFPGQYRFSYVLSEELPAVCADIQQLKQMLTNLVVNAVESYGNGTGEIIIRTGMRYCNDAFTENSYCNDHQPAGDYAYVEVTDYGCGMSEEALDCLCDPFFSTKFIGRGLGMSTVLGIVRGHKGLIHVRSVVGKGTTVQILFPPFASKKKHSAIEKRAPKHISSRHILLVDDEIMVRKVAQKMLERAGFTVLVARGGLEAVQQVEQHGDKIACILLDLTMPVMDGAETLEAIRKKNWDIPVILSSGYGEEEATSRLRNHHIAAFLSKPYKSSTLAKTLRNVLQ